jgi:hypothetical protein
MKWLLGEMTWEQLGSPTKPGIVEVEGIGSVLVTDYDMTRTRQNDLYGLAGILVGNEPQSDWKIYTWLYARNVNSERRVKFACGCVFEVIDRSSW